MTSPMPISYTRTAGWILICGCLLACSQPIEKAWEFPTGSPLYSTPLVSADLIVFGSEGGTLHAVDKNGKTRWRYGVPSAEIFSRPVTDGKFIFFGATNQNFYAVDLSGQLKWQFAARERIKSDPVLSGNKVIFTSYDGHVYALNVTDGKLVWQFPSTRKPKVREGEEATTEAEATAAAAGPTPKAFSYAAPAMANGLLFVGNLDGYLYALDAATGELKWRFQTGGGITSTALVHDGLVMFGSKDDHLYALDTASGKQVQWKFKTGGDVLGSPMRAGDNLFFGSNDNNLYVLDLKTGKEKCHFTAKGPILSHPVFYKDLALFTAGQGDGHLYAISKNDCQPFFQYKTGYKIESDPVLDGDRVYITSGDRKLYAFKINKTSK